MLSVDIGWYLHWKVRSWTNLTIFRLTLAKKSLSSVKTDSDRIRFPHHQLSLLQPDSPGLPGGLPACALLTLLRMMLPSWLCSLVVMSNMAPPSPGTMVYSTSAFLPMSRSWALILPTTEPSADDSGTRRWKKPVERKARRHAGVHRGGSAGLQTRLISCSFHEASRCTCRHVAAAYTTILYGGRALQC